jgi:hypothetical protein
MPKPLQVQALFEDCWQQLFKLHKSLAELKKINAQGWEFLNQAFQFPPTANAVRPESIDPANWRKRAEEARSLVDTMRTAEAKRSLAEIAESYDALASFQENTKSAHLARKQ